MCIREWISGARASVFALGGWDGECVSLVQVKARLVNIPNSKSFSFSLPSTLHIHTYIYIQTSLPFSTLLYSHVRIIYIYTPSTYTHRVHHVHNKPCTMSWCSDPASWRERGVALYIFLTWGMASTVPSQGATRKNKIYILEPHQFDRERQ